jgi:hypothetical protein
MLDPTPDAHQQQALRLLLKAVDDKDIEQVLAALDQIHNGPDLFMPYKLRDILDDLVQQTSLEYLEESQLGDVGCTSLGIQMRDMLVGWYPEPLPSQGCFCDLLDRVRGVSDGHLAHRELATPDVLVTLTTASLLILKTGAGTESWELTLNHTLQDN